MTALQTNEITTPIRVEQSENIVRVILQGDILTYNSEEPIEALHSLLQLPDIKTLQFTNDNLGKWDSSLMLIIFDAIKKAKELNIKYDISKLPQNLQDLTNLAFAVDRKPQQRFADTRGFFERLGFTTINIAQTTNKVLAFCAQTFGAVIRFFGGKSIMRQIDFLSAMEDCGPKALGIVSLISFLVGLILAFVGAVQLKEFGAQIYVASLVTIGMCRIMGAIMVGIIMAGRTGSSYAATIGTMQVNEELDALETMGLSRIDFLVLPRLLALVLAMPILTMLSDFMGMAGGAFVGVFLMDLPYQEYWKFAFKAFNLTNFLVGIFHGICFGVIISLCGCYQGLTCGRNADSVGIATTRSVVCAVVWMIVATGIITVICQELEI